MLAEIGSQDGVLQRLHGGGGHIFADDLKRARCRLAPTGQHRLARSGKGRRIREDRLGAEQRRGDAPLPAPVVALGDEQPLAAGTAKDIVVERALGEGVAVGQLDLLNQLGIHDEDGLEAEIVHRPTMGSS